jgi:hypothetical protein
MTRVPVSCVPRPCPSRSRDSRLTVWPPAGIVVQSGAVNHPIEITDEMRQTMDTARRQGLQTDMRTLATNIRAAAEGRYAGAEPGWQAGVEWTLLWIESTASQLTEGRP